MKLLIVVLAVVAAVLAAPIAPQDTAAPSSDKLSKALLFFYRKEGISPTEFREHFETTHVPLIKSLFGADFPPKFTREYPAKSDDGTPSVLIGDAAEFDYDAVATLEFASNAQLQRYLAKAADPQIHATLSEDDEKFSDPTKSKGVFLGNICVTKDGKSRKC